HLMPWFAEPVPGDRHLVELDPEFSWLTNQPADEVHVHAPGAESLWDVLDQESLARWRRCNHSPQLGEIPGPDRLKPVNGHPAVVRVRADGLGRPDLDPLPALREAHRDLPRVVGDPARRRRVLAGDQVPPRHVLADL